MNSQSFWCCYSLFFFFVLFSSLSLSFSLAQKKNVSGANARFRCIWGIIQKWIVTCNQKHMCSAYELYFTGRVFAKRNAERAQTNNHRLHRTIVATRMNSFRNIGFHIKYATDAKHRTPFHTTHTKYSTQIISYAVCVCVCLCGNAKIEWKFCLWESLEHTVWVRVCLLLWP